MNTLNIAPLFKMPDIFRFSTHIHNYNSFQIELESKILTIVSVCIFIAVIHSFINFWITFTNFLFSKPMFDWAILLDK